MHSPTETEGNVIQQSTSVSVILFILMAVIVFTNGFIVGLIIIRKCLRTISNLYIVLLSISQLLIGTFVIISTKMSHNVIVPSRTWCTVSPFVQLFAFTSAIFSLVGITVDRYRSVLQPHIYKPTVKNTVTITLAIITASVIYSLRTFIQNSVVFHSSDNNQHNLTILDLNTVDRYCDIFSDDSSSDLWFRVVDFFILLIIPGISMAIMYIKIIQKLWANNTTTTATAKTRSTIKYSVASVTTFIVCWLPFYLVEITYDSIGVRVSHVKDDVYCTIRYATVVLALSNSVFNPIIYGFLNKNIQRELFILKNKYCCKSNQISDDVAISRRLSTIVSCEQGNSETEATVSQIRTPISHVEITNRREL